MHCLLSDRLLCWIEPAIIASYPFLGLLHKRSFSYVVQSLRCCLLTVRFSTSWNKRSVILKLQSRPISLNLALKRSKTTGKKQDVKAFHWETITKEFCYDHAGWRNMNAITVWKYAQWFRFMQTYIPCCLNREAI